jgi:hypothetical protein
VNKVSEELTSDDPDSIQRAEILRIGEYFVSDIVDYNMNTERPGQQIIRSTSANVGRIFEEVFGKDAVPKLGRRNVITTGEVDYIALNATNPSRNMGEFLAQPIVPGKNTLYRAYANCFYWMTHAFQDPQNRNLGYYSKLQTRLSNYYKNAVVQWIRLRDNRNDLEKIIFPHVEQWIKTRKSRHLALKMAESLDMPTDGWIELYVLSKLHKIPIVIYDENNRVKWRFLDGVMEESAKPESRACINIMLGFRSGRSIPDTVEALYFS